ncbi:helix-turn-helix transcriptional regulator [Methylibium petroleiphilum]
MRDKPSEAAATGAPEPRSSPAGPERLVRLPEALNTVQVGRTAWLDLVREKKAPQPVKIGRATFWLASEIQAFIADRVRAARGGN